MSDEKIGYMCKVDYDYHIDGDEIGTRVFPSLDALLAHRPCVRAGAVGRCGVVKVSINLVEVVEKGVRP